MDKTTIDKFKLYLRREDFHTSGSSHVNLVSKLFRKTSISHPQYLEHSKLLLHVVLYNGNIFSRIDEVEKKNSAALQRFFTNFFREELTSLSDHPYPCVILIFSTIKSISGFGKRLLCFRKFKKEKFFGTL